MSKKRALTPYQRNRSSPWRGFSSSRFRFSSLPADAVREEVQGGLQPAGKEAAPFLVGKAGGHKVAEHQPVTAPGKEFLLLRQIPKLAAL